MTLKKLPYSFWASMLLGTCSFLLGLTGLESVFPEHETAFFRGKIFFGVLSYLNAFSFLKFKERDATAAAFMLTCIAYTLYFMWFGAAYEIAFFQTAIGCAFFRLKRSWIFPLMFGGGALGIFLTYYLQIKMSWRVPQPSLHDWIWVVMIFFVLSWMIQKFAIETYRRERERMMRFSLIGRDSTKLLHDLKGLISSPMMLIESLQNTQKAWTPEELKNQLSLLAADMSQIQNLIRSIQRTVAVNPQLDKIQIREVLNLTKQILERRLSRVELIEPTDRRVLASADLLHSVFFNLILNSLEAFEREKITRPQIHIFWEDGALIFLDNAGGLKQEPGQSSKGAGSGLGLELVAADMDSMKGRFTPVWTNGGARHQLRFQF